jgi:hypothetical protein
LKNPVLIQNSGIQTESFFVPPFELNRGELLVIHSYHGAHFYKTSTELIQLFTGQKDNEALKLHVSFSYASHFFYRESLFRKYFWPVTVEECIQACKTVHTDLLGKINEVSGLAGKTKVNTLGPYARKLISLYKTLSASNHIIFDLPGLDPESARAIYQVVKDQVEKGATAVLIDGYDEFQNDCDRFITLEWKVPFPIPKKIQAKRISIIPLQDPIFS